MNLGITSVSGKLQIANTFTCSKCKRAKLGGIVELEFDAYGINGLLYHIHGSGSDQKIPVGWVQNGYHNHLCEECA